MREKIFELSRITSLLDEIDDSLDSMVKILLIGGWAMSLRGDKEATKDIDIVLMSKREFNDLRVVLEKIGFNQRDELNEPYEKMNTSVFTDKRGYWIDLFFRRICKKFLLSENAIKRGTKFGTFENLDVTIMSREDIFLSKSITERVGISMICSLYTVED